MIPIRASAQVLHGLVRAQRVLRVDGVLETSEGRDPEVSVALRPLPPQATVASDERRDALVIISDRRVPCAYENSKFARPREERVVKGLAGGGEHRVH